MQTSFTSAKSLKSGKKVLKFKDSKEDRIVRKHEREILNRHTTRYMATR